MISHTHKYIFVHINKTGGTSITRSLHRRTGNSPQSNGAKGPKHGTAIELRRIYPKGFKNYFKFTFVRNPWDKILSQYFFRVGDKGRLRHAKRRWVSFEKFVKNPYIEGHRPQLDKISDNKGKILVDFIGRFENLQDDFDIVCDRLEQKPRKLGHSFRTHHKPYWEYYDDKSRKFIAKKYKKDIEYFGYKFGE